MSSPQHSTRKVLRKQRSNGTTQCSGGNLPPWIFEFVTTNEKNACHSGLERQRSGGIHHVGHKNHHKIKPTTREDSSTPFHFGRNDMSGGSSVLSARVIFRTLLGDGSSPLHCVIPFNPTGYIRNVAGVVPFNQSCSKTSVFCTVWAHAASPPK